MFVFTRLLQELRLDCTLKNGPGPLLGLSFSTTAQFPLSKLVCVCLTLYTSKTTSPLKLQDLNSFFPQCTPMFLLLHGCLSVIFALTSYSLFCCFGGNLLGFPLKILHNSPSRFMLFSQQNQRCMCKHHHRRHHSQRATRSRALKTSSSISLSAYL